MNKNNYLLEYRKDIHSQFGEDGVIDKIFQTINLKNKFCVEFGAWDGKLYSNTRNLIINDNWSGVLIEVDKARYLELAENYRQHTKVTCLNKLVNFEGDNSLDEILKKTDAPRDFDLLCIDIDGNDYYIWESLSDYEPKVVIIEFNPTIPNDIEFIQEKDLKVNQGTSLLSLVKLGKVKGYELITVTGCNAIFVKDNLFEKFDIRDNSPDKINAENKKYETKMFQLYDGTIVIHGCKRLVWKNRKIENEDIQVIPKRERYFGEKNNRIRSFFASFGLATIKQRIKNINHKSNRSENE